MTTTDDFIRENVPQMVAHVMMAKVIVNSMDRPKAKKKYNQRQIDRMYWKDRR